ncbi:sugar ABC transporter substrate-binding protein [Burkholderia pseudomallei]|uniref:sugar ABC transporter substrate-binding protein n=1 Tax=Burkholderia pseudomallei TaxID=28450 RepID=UPI000537261C|nr:sugar ABC transporter substrate-binding protein [Burkholderia pseudomallei]KGU60175.1 periplasmic binding domain protein [Burkholderia pseudomallei MSHR983]OND00924.1 ABC transporter substrate-binding protein [Burkholderia pseudomallei]OND00971.1 ABC transporter substrate-binding protein [Burkholderia pseudomallei]OND03365.1 ABC transporter substrate-binding protein [Burkholderia pseudomallei]OND19960.1 ABC transporter substrate-binding protein [Burkholderia pseudomallei]
MHRFTTKPALTLATAIGLAVMASSALAQNEQPLKFDYIIHSSASNTFWQAVKKGMDEACTQVKAQCQMIFTQTEGSVSEQASNLQAALAGKPDAIATTIVDDKAIEPILKEARNKGVTVLAANVDSSKGAKGSVRQAFIGQSFDAAGYALAQKLAEKFPKSGPVNVLVGISAPGQNWSEQRGAGVMRFMADYKAANPGRKITWKRIDSGTDLAVTAERVGAYLNANPDTTAYFDTGFWHAGVAKALKDRGVPPGKILLGGFDIVPDVLNSMKAGYIQVEVDQQPFLQGYLPVIQANLIKKYKLSAWDVETGKGLLLPEQVDGVIELSKKGYR